MYSAELKKIVEVFELESVLPELSLEGRSVLRKEINRPALQLAGFYERFDSDRLQVIGRVEYSYLLSLILMGSSFICLTQTSLSPAILFGCIPQNRRSPFHFLSGIRNC